MSGDSYSDEYQAIVDYANGAAIALPSKSQQVLQDVLVQSLVAEGIWNLLDGLWVFATDSEEFALINWINPGNFSFVKSATPPTFVSNVGFKQNAVNMNLTSTGFFTSGSPNFQQFTVSSSGRLTYTGATTANFHIKWTVTISGNAINENIIGVINDNSGTYTRISWEEEDSTSTDRHSVSAHGTFTMSNGDWVEPRLTAESNGTVIRIISTTFSVKELK